LSQRLQGHTQIVEVDIPDGKSEEELWEIFEAISKAVQEGDEIVFDITHGFRSLPMIAMLTIAYLKQVKGVKVQHVVYGVYERDNHGSYSLTSHPLLTCSTGLLPRRCSRQQATPASWDS
jgi:CRISPR-associated Csx2 family protein